MFNFKWIKKSLKRLNDIKVFYFIFCVFILKIQFLALPMMEFFLSKIDEKSASENLFDPVSPNSYLTLQDFLLYVEKSGVKNAKMMADTNVYMIFCLTLSTVLILKVLSSKNLTKLFNFNVVASNITLIKFSAVWVIIYSFLNIIIFLLNFHDSIYSTLTLISGFTIFYIMIQDKSFGFQLQNSK